MQMLKEEKVEDVNNRGKYQNKEINKNEKK